MQIDFHHAVTYVAARLAGFTKNDADIIAYSAQYVDDATCDGAIRFNNKAIYKRISSSYKTIDFENMDPVEDLLVWMPFHFLPGNGGKAAGIDPDGTFIRKLICRPDSPVAKEMVNVAILDRYKPYSLHRFGIAMHVYADTWAHQGFAGVLHDINDVDCFDETDGYNVFEGGLRGFLNGVLESVVPPLGHGKANIFPDMPFLSWKYRDGFGQEVFRNNTAIFCEAANCVCKAMQRYQGKTEAGIGSNDMNSISELFTNLRQKDGYERHAEWLKAIANGKFSFGPELVSYAEDGENSWKAQALGDSDNHGECHEYVYRDTFLSSNWKLFHDALQLHRLTVSHDILPRYGICAA